MELWDVSTGQKIATFKSDHSFGALTFSPDGRYVAVSFDSAVAIWDISTVAHGTVYHEEETVAKLHGYSTGKIKTFGGNVEVASVYFSSDGNKIKFIYSGKLFEYCLNP